MLETLHCSECGDFQTTHKELDVESYDKAIIVEWEICDRCGVVITERRYYLDSITEPTPIEDNRQN